ncbi:FAD-binding domain-containing protein [Phthorimaea operculella]|nr:FAD-binding domain-containing protein [Phthorimaea operculella]
MASIIFTHIYLFFKSRIFLISWIALISFLFYNSFIYYKDGPQFYHLRQILGFGLCVSRGTATVINLCAALVLLPLGKKLNQLLYRGMSKTCPGVFFFWLERTKSFHMTVAITLFIAGVVHSVSHFVNLWNFTRKYDELHPEVNLATHKNQNPLELVVCLPGLTGVFMLLITTAMCTMSSRFIRRRIYNAFWYTHQLYLPFILLLIIHPLSGALKQDVLKANVSKDYYSSHEANGTSVHANKFESITSTTWLWMAFPLTCFLIDLIWRIFDRNRSSVNILKVNAMAGRTIGLTMSCPHEGFDCRPGQYVLLQCPDISLLEWHPFTVVKMPTTSDRSFVVWIKVVGDWTEALENLLVEKCSTNVKMLVDGPMVSPMERAMKCKVAVCVAAGVGITPFVPVLEQLLSDPRGDRPGRVHLLWIVRTEREAGSLADLATRCLQELRNNNRPDRLQIQIHITGTPTAATSEAAQTYVDGKGVTYVVQNENVTLLTEDIKKTDRKEQYSLAKEFPVLGCRVKRGRPYWDGVFGYWVHLYPEAHLTLFCCGPKKLVNTLRNKSKHVSINTKTKITFVHERFS